LEDILDYNIDNIKGIGPKYKKYLNKVGIYTIRDLFYYLPYDYEDRRFPVKVSELVDGNKFLIHVSIDREPKLITTRKKLTILTSKAGDETGEVEIKWFNQPYIKNKILVNKNYYMYGTVKKENHKIILLNPEISLNLNEKFGSIVPKYSLTKGLTNNFMIKILKEAFNKYLNDLKNIFNDDIYNKYNIEKRRKALYNAHFPQDYKTLRKSIEYIEIEKLVLMQIAFEKRKKILSKKNSNIIDRNKKLDLFIKSLPFKLTECQRRVLAEILKDLQKENSMNRLLQGDVGSGKTIVAFLTLINAVLEGYQGALMVPTEVLAKQHYETFIKLFGDFKIKIDVLYSSLNKKDKDEIINNIKEGKTSIVIGTHSLIQNSVNFKQLGYIVTDEQHRFGVEQRGKLINKGKNPHVLVMSATPIPRTLALIIYNDLNISTINKNPPGRKEIKTHIISKNGKGKLYKFLKKKINKGEQAYIVSPLIEESEKIENIKSAEEIFRKFLKSNFTESEVCLIHGKLKSEEAEKVINRFKKGICKILVSTTVIEVGIDIKNATIMIIVNAERFGLAQLHQLRGRVGRGSRQSYCFLLTESKSEKSINRLKILEKTNNGFEISKEDLQIRGPGEFLGTKQSGNLDNLINFDIKNIKVSKEIKEIIIKKIDENTYNYDKIMNEVNQVYKKKVTLN